MAFKPRVSSVPADSPVPMPAPIWGFCFSRGIRTPEQIEGLFQPKMRDLAHPFSISEMDKAVERLVSALQKGEKIGIYADYDLDGTPGITLLADGLRQLGYQHLICYQPSRLADGYGFHESFVRKFKDEGVTLIVTVDVGITDIATVSAAEALGIDVILTDHHLPKEKLPSAHAILNPNKGTCSSKLQHLCGTGVAFYLLLALKMELEQKGLLKNEFNSKRLLDLFALATITDMVPLIGENRVLVKHGLKQFSETERPGLRELISNLGFSGRAISSQDIAFRIAPKLNALTRLDEGVRAIDVLTANSETAKRFVQDTMSINDRRRAYQDKARQVVDQMLDDRDKSKFLFIYSHEFHPGVVSLIASDLMNRFKVPAFVGSVLSDGSVVGSARSPGDHVDLQEILGKVSSELNRFGGHTLAAGFEFSKENAGKLDQLFAEAFRAEEADAKTVRARHDIYYDAVVTIDDINPTLLKWIDAAGPFGMQFEAPRFLLKDVGVKSCRKLSGGFLKYVLEKDGRTIEAPWFSGAQEIAVGSRINAAIEPQMNEYMGRKTVQANLVGVEVQ